MPELRHDHLAVGAGGMMAALTPLTSWLLFGGWLLAVALILLFFMGASRASDPWFDQDADPIVVRLYSGVYDASARGDFDHDPIRDHEWCDGCATLLRHALNRISDRHMGPRSADDLVAAIREELEP